MAMPDCGCGGRKRPAVGRPIPRAAGAGGAAITAAAVSRAASASQRWTTSCDPSTSTESMMEAARAARACGGRLLPV